MRTLLQIVLFGLLVQSTAVAQFELDARYRHVFPQVADGHFEDGTGYATSFVVTNESRGWAHCYFQLYGLSTRRLDDTSFWIYGAGVHMTSTKNVDTFDQGYAVLECTQPVTANATYKRTGESGENLSMAMVSSSPIIRGGHQVVIQGEGQRTAIAIVNDRLWINRYQLTLFDQFGRIWDIRVFDLGPGGFMTRFVDELLSVPGGDFIGTLEITGGHFHAIGMFFDGGIFTTVPVTRF